MATVGPISVFSVNLNTATTYTSAIDLGGSYRNIGLSIPAIASGNVRVQVSDKIDGTFKPLYLEPVAGTTTPKLLDIVSTVCNCVVPIKVPAQFIKLEISTITSDSSAAFQVMCSSN